MSIWTKPPELMCSYHTDGYISSARSAGTYKALRLSLSFAMKWKRRSKMPDPLPKNITLEPLPFEEAIAVFQDRVPMTPGAFYALADDVRERAFTVSRVSSMDVITDVHNAVLKAIDSGETLASFQARLGEIMEARGWEGMTPWHTETVFRNNVQSSYMAGRYKQMVDQADDFPYWEYDAVNDRATRPTHAALDGKIFPANHSFWNTWYPPNGHRCRCSVNPVHKYDVDMGGAQTIEIEDPTGTLIEPTDPATGGKMPAQYLMPDPGWEKNAAKSAWEPDLTKYPDELRNQFEAEKGSRP